MLRVAAGGVLLSVPIEGGTRPTYLRHSACTPTYLRHILVADTLTSTFTAFSAGQAAVFFNRYATVHRHRGNTP